MPIPNFLDNPLLDLIRDGDKICKYIDIPFQHVSRPCCSVCAAAKAAAQCAKRLRDCAKPSPD